jgi:hypothetical protein
MLLKNYITQVAAFIVDTLLEPLPVVFHVAAGHFEWNNSEFLSYRLLKSFQSLGAMLVYLGFKVAPEKKKENRTESSLGNAAANRCHHARRQYAQETFL